MVSLEAHPGGMTMSSHSEQPSASERRDNERRHTKVEVEADRRESERRCGKDRRGAPRV